MVSVSLTVIAARPMIMLVDCAIHMHVSDNVCRKLQNIVRESTSNCTSLQQVLNLIQKNYNLILYTVNTVIIGALHMCFHYLNDSVF